MAKKWTFQSRQIIEVGKLFSAIEHPLYPYRRDWNERVRLGFRCVSVETEKGPRRVAVSSLH